MKERFRLALLMASAQLITSSAGCGGRTAALDDQGGAHPGDAGASGGDSGPGPSKPEQVIGGIAGPRNLLVHQGRMFWSAALMTPDLDTFEIWGCELDDCAGTKARYASDGGQGAVIAADGDRIYWGGTYSMGSCPMDGCAAPPSSECGVQPNSLAVDGERLYWTTGSTTMYGELRAGTNLGNGCDALTLNTSPSGMGAGAVTVDDLAVFWIRDGASGSIMMIPKSGGTPVELATAQNLPSALWIDSDSVHWTTRWAAGSILRCPKTGCGGAPVVVLTNLQKPDALIGDGSRLYWTLSPSVFGSEAKEEIYACVRSDCVNTSQKLTETAAVPGCRQRLAQDDSYLYWAEDPEVNEFPTAANGSIMRIHK